MRLEYRGMAVESRQVASYRVWLERYLGAVADLFGLFSCRVRNKNDQDSAVV